MAPKTFVEVVKRDLEDQHTRRLPGASIGTNNQYPQTVHPQNSGPQCLDTAAARMRLGRIPPRGHTHFEHHGVKEDNVVVPVPAINLASLRWEISFLRRHMVIVRFLTNLSPEIRHIEWIRELEGQLGGKAELHKAAGNGFYYIQLASPEFMPCILGLIPYRLRVGVAMIHPWIPAFNPSNPVGLASPTWIYLQRLPLEYLPNATLVVEAVGRVLDTDLTAPTLGDPRFYILIHSSGNRPKCVKIEDKDRNFIEVGIAYEEERSSEHQQQSSHEERQNWRPEDLQPNSHRHRSPDQLAHPQRYQRQQPHDRFPTRQHYRHNGRNLSPPCRSKRLASPIQHKPQADTEGYNTIERKKALSPRQRIHHTPRGRRHPGTHHRSNSPCGLTNMGA
jgi:hypothetical protein